MATVAIHIAEVLATALGTVILFSMTDFLGNIPAALCTMQVIGAAHPRRPLNLFCYTTPGPRWRRIGGVERWIDVGTEVGERKGQKSNHAQDLVKGSIVWY